MIQIKSWLTSERIFRITLIAVSIIVITIAFPGKRIFKFEYQKGKPWAHSTLIAPFDFPIYKLENELKAEKDSVLKYVTPYYNYNSKISIEEKERLRDYFDNYWKTNYLKLGVAPTEKEIFLKQLLKLYSFVYDRGIVEIPDGMEYLQKKSHVLMFVKDNVADEIEFDFVFTSKSAYEYIRNALSKTADLFSTEKGINTNAFFKGLKLENYLVPNLFYDEQATEQSKNTTIKNISLTRGMIQGGERIIFTGDVITEDTFRELESLKTEYEKRVGYSMNYFYVVLGQLLISFLMLFTLLVFIQRSRKEIYNNRKKLMFIFFLITLFTSIASILVGFNVTNLYVIPFAIVAIIVKSFFDGRLALVVHTITIIIIGFWAPNSFEFVYLNFIAGIVGIFSVSNLYRRGKIFYSSVWIFAAYSISYLAISLYKEGNIHTINVQPFIYFTTNSLLIITAILLTFIFEKMFGFLSDASLLELSDTNQPLLRKLAEIAPGTFQHSVQVASLAEEAIFQVGGNPLLVRTGALYHDIGKMENAIFFIENQTEGLNPHDNIEFEESSKIIIGHVSRGVALGTKYKLPYQIVDFIRTHHGTTTVQYFYRSYIKKYPDSPVDTNSFIYPGPKPFSREQAVLMMADSIEAASRSLKEYSYKSIHELVENIINAQLKEEQFNDSNITFREITQIKEIFKRRLKNIYHVRVEYPSAV